MSHREDMKAFAGVLSQSLTPPAQFLMWAFVVPVTGSEFDRPLALARLRLYRHQRDPITI
jgi:hypothetical protein